MIYTDVREFFLRHDKTYTIDGLRVSDTVLEFLAEAERKTRVPSRAAWLSFAGQRLQPERTLASYGVGSGSTVVLRVRGIGGGAVQRVADPSQLLLHVRR